MVDVINKVPLLSRQVYDYLLKVVMDAKPGDRLYSERKLSDILTVSRKTVRSAIAQLEDEGLVVSKQGGGTFITDRIRSKHVEALFFHLPFEPDDNGFYPRCYRAMKKAVESAGHTISLIATDHPKRMSGPAFDTVCSGVKPSLLVTLGIMDHTYIESLSSFKLPLITVDYDAAGMDADGIIFDTFGAGRIMTARLIRMGHRRIGIIGAHRGRSVQGFYRPEPDSVRIRAGYEYTLQEHGLPRNEQFIAEVSMNETDGAAQAAVAMLRSPDRPTAIITFEHRHAQAVIESAAALGLSCPGDLSVIAYAGSAGEGATRLARIQTDVEALGTAAGQMIVFRLEDETGAPTRIISIPTALLPGETIAPIKA
jgi:DNA-binding LacI/PurR family transcriptional regulator